MTLTAVVAAFAAMLLLMGPAAAATGDTVADRVFGQGGSFTSSTCNLGGVSASSKCFPGGVAVDGAGNVYVADGFNNRVLEYDSPLTTDMVADRVFGQPNFTTSSCGVGASSLCLPLGVAVDSAGNLYVADKNHSRVLEYNTPLTTDTVADRVFGQGGSFTSDTCNLGGVSASSLCTPIGVAVDSAGNLFVVDVNNRVLEYNTPLTTDTVADRVFG
jgi:sugar lactone lactonase YvrE